MREAPSLFILVSQLTFSLTGTTCLTDRADLLGKSDNNKYIILFQVLLTRLTTEDLPHDFYMTICINDISRRRNINNIKYKQNILRSYIISTVPLNKKGILLTTTTTSVARHNIIGRRERRHHQDHLLEHCLVHLQIIESFEQHHLLQHGAGVSTSSVQS